MKKYITLTLILISVFSFSSVQITAEDNLEYNLEDKYLTEYSDGRLVEGNDVRFITPQEMRQRFMDKTEFIKEDKYNNYISNYPLRFANNEYARTRDIWGQPDLFPADFENWSNYDKAIFAEVFYYPQSEMTNWGNLFDDNYSKWKSNAIATHMRYIDWTFPNNDENTEIYKDALTEVYIWYLNNYMLDKKTLYNPYDDDFVPTVEVITTITTAIKSDSEVTSQTVTQEVKSEKEKPKGFFEKYWFSFAFLGFAMLIFLVYKIIKRIKNPRY